MQALTLTAPAKINLALHVTGRRADGLHLLDSLVMFADLGDRLQMRLAERSRLTVAGPMAAGVPGDGRNLVLRAADMIGVTAEITLEKFLPAAAGIGGGSSDAAATLRGLSRLSGRDIPPGSERLGADLPVCLMGRAARIRGIGERLAALEGLPDLPAVLVNPRVEMPTSAVFGALARRDNPAMPEAVPGFADPVAMADWLARQRNDLEPPAVALQPQIGTVLAALRATPGALLARMSGSGATCFALYRDADTARAAAAELSAGARAWWVAPVTLS